MSLVVYGVVLMTSELPGEEGPLPLALSGVAAMEVPMLFFMRFQLLGPTLGLFAPNDMRVDTVAPETAVSAAVRKAAAKFNTGCIVGFAIAESIAIFGFVGSFISGEPIWYMGWSTVAAGLLVLQFPRTEGVLGLLEASVRVRVRELLN